MQTLENAARGGWVDAIMVAVDPLLVRENKALNEALDAAHGADIGLVSMKEMRAVKEAPEGRPAVQAGGSFAAPGGVARGLERRAVCVDMLEHAEHQDH